MRHHWILTVLVLAACGPRPDAAPHGDLTVGTTPSLDLPGADPDGNVRFTSIASAIRLGDGSILLADRREHVLRLVLPDGAVRTIGREGSGPGEFASPSWIGRCGGDSAWIWDPGLERMSVYIGGTIVRSYGISPVPALLTCTPDHRMAYFGPFLPTPISLATIDQVVLRGPLYLDSMAGHDPRLLDTLPMGQMRPLGRISRLAMSPVGLAVGTASSDSILIYGNTGVGVIRTGEPPRSATPAHYDRAIEQMLAMMPGSREAEAMLRRIPMPDHLPALTGLFWDPQSLLWVQLSVPGDSTTRLRVFDGEGKTVGEVSIPGEIQVMEVGTDYLLASREGTDGEIHLVMHPVSGRGDSSSN